MSTETEIPRATTSPKKYFGWSALLTGLARMWRATVPALIFIVANAVLQALMVLSDPLVGLNVAFITGLIASVVFMAVTAAILTSAGLLAVAGPAGFNAVYRHASKNFVWFCIWAALQAVVVSIGYAFYTWPGVILWALTVFVPLAAMAGERNPIAANFTAIGSHWIHWILTIIFIGFMGFVAWLLSAVTDFFVGGFVGSFVTCLAVGILAWWWVTAWAAIFRSRRGAFSGF